MPTISLTASDTLFFGTGRPFTMGEDSWTKGMFPPNPETLYGFLRSCYFLDNMSDLGNANAANDPTGGLRITNYGLLKQENNTTTKLFAWPLDLVINEKKKTSALPLVIQTTPIISNSALQTGWKLMETTEEKLRRPEGINFITESDFQNYIEGKYDGIIPHKLSDLIGAEPKIGIFLNRFNSEEKELYRLQMNRLETIDFVEKKYHQISFWIEYDGIKLSNILTSRIGGEGKLVFINETGQTSTRTSFTAKSGDIIRIYLNSPALFDKGWLPEIMGAELLTAAIGNPIYISGFDIKTKLPKPMVKTVPAGSVYYYKILSANCSLPEKLGNDNHKGYGNVSYSQLSI